MRARRIVPALAFASLFAAGACDGGEAAVPAPLQAGAPSTDATTIATEDAGDGATEPDGATLVANAGPARYVDVGANVVLDGTGSQGAVRFAWDFGDGRHTNESTSPIANVTYDVPGRYQAVLTVWDAAGNKRTASALVTATYPATFSRSESAPLLVMPDLGRVAVVSPDSDEVVMFADRAGGFVETARFSVGDEPRALARFAGYLVVTCAGADAIELLPETGAGARKKLVLGYGTRPIGAAVVGSSLYVTLSGTGEVARITVTSGVPTLAAKLGSFVDARAVSALPGGKLALTRFRSPDDKGVLSIVDAPDSATPTVTTVPLALDTQLSSDTEIGGVPSYLAHVAVSPTGREAALPSLQANVIDGTFKNGRALRFETTIRAVVSFVDLANASETFSRRKQFDNRGLALGATYSSRGDYLYVVMPGNRTVERLDVLTEVLSGSVGDIGFAPDGVALSPDDATLYVSAPLSRELVVYDVGAFDTPAAPLARLPLVKSEPLASDVLLGKRLFNDAADPRLAKDGYLACAHCHLEGDSDRRVWDFTDRGEGLRNTTSLLGRAGTADGPLHWSANFDEVQDFEHDMRDAFEGHGLMLDADFHTGTRDQKLGDKKAGVSADLDALAAYVSSLASAPRSPKRPGDGLLSAAATRGATVFANAGCGACHAGARLTDSSWLSPGVPNLHDVGTMGAGSGKRLGAALAGIDTPTLRGAFASPPYLHDGSAPTLRDVLVLKNASDKHGTTSTLSSADLADLVEYLESL